MVFLDMKWKWYETTIIRCGTLLLSNQNANIDCQNFNLNKNYFSRLSSSIKVPCTKKGQRQYYGIFGYEMEMVRNDNNSLWHTAFVKPKCKH